METGPRAASPLADCDASQAAKARRGLYVIVPGTDRILRDEIASAAIQGTAAALSIPGLIFLIMRAPPGPDVMALIGVVVYGLSLTLAFLASALYHGISYPRIKSFFRTIDHCTIFLLIAGTYTPITILALWKAEGWLLLGAVWLIAASGVALRLWRGPRFHRIAIRLYLVMGWLALAWGGTLYHALGPRPMLLILAGAVAYTGGLAFYRAERLPFSNPLWHLCVVLGSACFFAVIALYLLPSAAASGT
jgi:hemolysin III